jgi:tRNA A-37 threonylcarbamoyl transferase component Bud32
VRLKVRGFDWRVSGEEGRALVLSESPDLTSLRERSAERVKHSSVRTVWRLDGYYVKEYRPHRLTDYLQTLVRGSKARAEWRAAARLRAAGLATFEPMAMGERRRHGLVERSILVTRAIAASTPLADLLVPGRLAPARRRGLLGAAARFLRALHDAGIEHPDLHEDNLLVTDPDSAAPRLHIIDLHRLRVGRRLTRRARVRNLGLVGRAFRFRMSCADRLRCYRAYVDGCPEMSSGKGRAPAAAHPNTRHSTLERRLIRAILRAERRQERRLWRSRDRRSMRRGEEFNLVRTRRIKARMVAVFAQPMPRRWLENPDALIEQDQAEFVKCGRSATVVRTTILEESGPRSVYVKRFNMKKRRHRYQRTRAMNSWRLARALVNRGIATPEPLAAVNVRWLGVFTRKAYFITEEVAGAEPADRLLARPEVTPAARAALARAFGREVRRLHDAGFSHRDLQPRNLLATLSDGADGPSARVWIIDLDAVRRWPFGLPSWRRASNVARLLLAVRQKHADAVGKAECRAFLDGYLGPWVRQEEREAWCRRIEAQVPRLSIVRRQKRKMARS